jgi:flagellin-like hook-associated protein FlgL
LGSSITINSNPAALVAQRRLGQTTQQLQGSFTRLSSGLRINKAADDAAGLAIAESLNVDTRVFTQAMRNVNDGISLTSIAEGTLQALSGIVTRQRELATQAANETLNLPQRRALNQEANALVDEFNRLVNSTEFNDLQLLNGTVGSIAIQAGYGAAGTISFATAAELARGVGAGTFQGRTSYATGWHPGGLSLADVNYDGNNDIIEADTWAGTFGVFLGNGNGSFKARQTYESGGYTDYSLVDDLNGDGVLDLTFSSHGSIAVLMGNVNGSFSSRTTYTSGAYQKSVASGDFNGDGKKDLVSTGHGEDTINIFIGRGDGTFQPRLSLAIGPDSHSVTTADFNGDGRDDMAVFSTGDNIGHVFLGKSDGTFAADKTFSAIGSASIWVQTGDLNGDGLYDLATADYWGGTSSVYLGRGDGSFNPAASYSIGVHPGHVLLRDYNGDGRLDILAENAGSSTVSILQGRGDGTFSPQISVATGATAYHMGAADLNNDGAIDLVTAECDSEYSLGVLFSNVAHVTTAPYLNIATVEGALEAMDSLDQMLERISGELAALGSTQSRLSVAYNTLSASAENYAGARSQIVDADIAWESAQLVRSKILQQAGAAVLAQANQSPALALKLLGAD